MPPPVGAQEEVSSPHCSQEEGEGEVAPPAGADGPPAGAAQEQAGAPTLVQLYQLPLTQVCKNVVKILHRGICQRGIQKILDIACHVHNTDAKLNSVAFVKINNYVKPICRTFSKIRKLIYIKF
jgi:hypothetical protein